MSFINKGNQAINSLNIYDLKNEYSKKHSFNELYYKFIIHENDI